MNDVMAISAELREREGTGPSRATRRCGRIPAVIYGGSEPPIMISVDAKEIGHQARQSQFLRQMYKIEFNGKKYQVLARDVQFHPVTDKLMHVDFYRFRPDSRIRIAVTVVFENENDSPRLLQYYPWCALLRLRYHFPLYFLCNI